MPTNNFLVPLIALGLYSQCNNVNMANNTTMTILILALLLKERQVDNLEENLEEHIEGSQNNAYNSGNQASPNFVQPYNITLPFYNNGFPIYNTSFPVGAIPFGTFPYGTTPYPYFYNGWQNPVVYYTTNGTNNNGCYSCGCNCPQNGISNNNNSGNGNCNCGQGTNTAVYTTSNYGTPYYYNTNNTCGCCTRIY